MPWRSPLATSLTPHHDRFTLARSSLLHMNKLVSPFFCLLLFYWQILRLVFRFRRMFVITHLYLLGVTFPCPELGDLIQAGTGVAR